MKIFLIALITSFQLSVMGSEISVLEKINLYKQESSRYMSIGNYYEACEYLKVAYELALNEKISAQSLQQLQASKNKSCGLLKEENEQRSRESSRKFDCERYRTIVRSCAEAGDIDGCVRIKSGGVSLSKMNTTCR